ncbi:glutathione S-transferase family protein [Paucibacter sp. TC2R-5]|uniref:glutathione S-transferase family protein n=1 Tax=Paucibacter sp. TC2R-5 TaxID=2893555 RepID=UPI0021E4B703|nr:glutathione S-transferase family protein [Paucibacter sp. TC2R-5]MCV2358221.1 glutathione S-transferase family protein [Paucibacter sp. TC2R-5]
MIQLHYFPSNASMAPHIVLEEIGQPFELKQVDRANNGHKSAEYLKLNPNGLIPVLVDGDMVLYETAAILLHLADTHPAAGLLPALGTAERAQAYKWLIWLTNTLQPALIAYFYPDRWVKAGNTEGAAEVQAAAEARVVELLAQVEAQLASHGGPWLLGADYSAADAMAFMLCRWTRGFASRPARDFPLISAYLQRMLARPALQRMLATEALPQPWV